MASSSFAQLRSEIRNDFRDELETMFSDEQLDAMIDEGQREYCLATGCLHGRTEVVIPFGGGPCIAPADFIRPERMESVDGGEIKIVSQSFLDHGCDWRRQQGRYPRAVVFDFDSWGLFRLAPLPEDGKVVGTLYYERFPASGILEVKERDTLCEYALFLAYTYAGKPQAVQHMDAWNGMVRQRRAQRGSLYARPRIRSGMFY